MPPPVRPSDQHSPEQGEWWRGDKENPETDQSEAGHEGDIDVAERNEKAFDESQRPNKFPT